MSKNDPNDFQVCMCFHVPLRKLVKHYRLNTPKVASQMSECYGAGTGCGFCIPFLKSIFKQMSQSGEASIKIAAEEYGNRRKKFHDKIGFDEKTLDDLLPDSPLDLEQVLDEIPDDMKLE